MNEQFNYDKLYKSPAWLKKQWIDFGATGQEIADMCGVSKATITYFIRKFGLIGKKKNTNRYPKQRLMIHMMPSMWKDLKNHAKKSGLYMAEIGRCAIHEYLKKR